MSIKLDLEKEGYIIKGSENSVYPKPFKSRIYNYYTVLFNEEKNDVKILYERKSSGNILEESLLNQEEIENLKLNAEHPVMKFLSVYKIINLRDKLDSELDVKENSDNKIKI